ALVTREPSLITRDPRNLAADEKHFVQQYLRLSSQDWDSPLGQEFIRRGYFSDWQQSATWERQRTLAEHAGMQVARNWTAAVCFPDQFECDREPASMVPVPMREDHGIDATKIDTQSSAVVFDGEFHRASIEEDRVAPNAVERSDDERQSMIGTT